MNIFLVGFMGSGKTTIGQKLAERLKKDFLDLDTLIETQQGKKIGEIFAAHGENEFRQIEHDMLKSLEKFDNKIVSVGGGAPCFFNNIDWMNQNGLSIYLKLSPEALTNRLIELPKVARDARPLIANKTKDELLEFVTATLLKREPFYLKSKIVVMNEGPDANFAIDRIINALNYYQ